MPLKICSTKTMLLIQSHYSNTQCTFKALRTEFQPLPHLRPNSKLGQDFFFPSWKMRTFGPKLASVTVWSVFLFPLLLTTDLDEPSGVGCSRRTTCTFGGVRSEAYVAASGSHELITGIGGDITPALRYTFAVAKR